MLGDRVGARIDLLEAGRQLIGASLCGSMDIALFRSTGCAWRMSGVRSVQ